ncbi:MAG: hypothetical protein KAH96_03380 [Alphaproteobacteria bacterium]|nr:hypothetical protein [Alphaproteobacteria bacterium]
MEEFNISLVREKIVFTDDEIGEDDDNVKAPVIIRSNRIFLKLGSSPSLEKVVIRAQNMHTTLRLAGKILYSYYRKGSLLGRDKSFNWTEQWDAVLSSYERNFNPQIWAAVYVNGGSVFKTRTSPFVDVIEKCALLTIDNYDATMEVTESALKQIGHAMRIDHASNVAAILTDTGDSMRCGIIQRTSRKDTTFSFTGTGGDRHNRIVQFIGIAAAYLELFNLRFTIRTLQEKIRSGEIKKVSPESNQIRAAIVRQSALNKAIFSHEEIYDIKYRPARPDLFSDM